jgi:hypothetical protein
MITQHSIQSVTPEGGGVWWTTAERCALIRKQLILSETQLTSLIIIVWNSMEGLKPRPEEEYKTTRKRKHSKEMPANGGLVDGMEMLCAYGRAS